jgi:lipid-binding SYLF domain-containing protein
MITPVARGILLLALSLFALTGTATAGWDPNGKAQMIANANATVAEFKKADSSLQTFFNKAYGYVVFPTIGKGGFIVGGATGRGVVYGGGTPIGVSRLSQGTFGAQIGGQAYSQMIFFEDKGAFERFKSGNLKFSAQATAVAVTEGAAKAQPYENGVAVFTLVKGGLMAEATIGGQHFSYQAF